MYRRAGIEMVKPADDHEKPAASHCYQNQPLKQEAELPTSKHEPASARAKNDRKTYDLFHHSAIAGSAFRSHARLGFSGTLVSTRA